MTPDPFWPLFWTAASAIATSLAVLVALFGQSFRDKFFPPRLSLRLITADGEATEAIIRSPADEEGEVKKRRVPARYYHLRVSNARRWSKATDTQVILTRLEERTANGEFDVTWTGAVPFGWRHQELYGVTRTVGADADVDLCSVVKEKWVQLHLLVHPTNLETIRREAMSIQLHIQAVANEASSAPMRIQLSWDGAWSDDTHEMRRHMVVDVLPPLGE